MQILNTKQMGCFMRYAARRDENEKVVVEALRAVGATVYYLDEPCDLLVGYHGKTLLMEVKNKKNQYGKKGFNENQKHFAENWKGGPFCLVDSVESALRMLKLMVD
jgi:hypothetical protein